MEEQRQDRLEADNETVKGLRKEVTDLSGRMEALEEQLLGERETSAQLFNEGLSYAQACQVLLATQSDWEKKE